MALPARPLMQSENATGLPDALKAGVETLSALPMDDVRVHYNSPKPSEVQAMAYARGSEIHVGPGQERHLPHEAWHVVQQKQGRVKPKLRVEGAPVNEDRSLEQEADAMGERASAGGVGATMKKPGGSSTSGAVKPGIASPAAIQRVAVKLFAGLDAETPSSYDAGGGHSYADHGAHTTSEQHVTRVKTGVAPSGRVSRVPNGKGSSKFKSDDQHKLAFKTAYTDIQDKNKNRQKVRGAGNVIPLAGAGPIYYADGKEETCDKVQLDIQSVDDDTIRINSMYPVK
jgi:hypothetical protein